MEDLSTLQTLADGDSAIPDAPDLEQGGAQADGDGSAGDQPAAAAAPAPLTAADLEAVRAQLKAIEDNNKTLEQRLRDTQSWGNQNNQARILAEGLLQAKRADEAERQRAEAAAQQ